MDSDIPETVMSRHHPHTPTFESSSNSVRFDDPVHNDTKTSINQDNRNNDINNNSPSIPSAYVPASGTQNSDFDLPAVLNIFRQCFNGRPPSLPVPPIKMSPSHYHQLLGELRLQPTLDAYVRDKSRSVLPFSILCLVSTIFLPPSSSLFPAML